jgi:predicted DNA-binding transcriptional regulator AlpA
MEDAAQKLGVKKSTLKKWRAMRKGPASFKLGAWVAYEVAAIDAYVAACKAADSRSNPALNPLTRVPQPRISHRAA